MKRTLIIAIASFLLLVVILSACGGEQFNSNYKDRQVPIRSEVNLRKDHGMNSDVIIKLHPGDLVVLTGNSYEYVGGAGKAGDSWTQVQTETGETGWIVTQSIRW